MLAADLVLGPMGVEGLQHQLAIGVSAGGGRLRVCLGRLKTCPAGLSGCVWFIHRNGVASSRRRAVLSADTNAGLIKFLELVSLAISMPGRLMARSLARAA